MSHSLFSLVSLLLCRNDKTDPAIEAHLRRTEGSSMTLPGDSTHVQVRVVSQNQYYSGARKNAFVLKRFRLIVYSITLAYFMNHRSVAPNCFQ